METILLTFRKAQTKRHEYLIYTTAFFVPLVLNHNQIITGTMVNVLLYIAAIKLSRKHLLPLSILPSIAALTNGLIFGSFTSFLFYFLPFIWLSNLVLMTVFKYADKVHPVFRVILASLAKSILLFSVAALFVSNSIVPKIFLTAMGQLQLMTALLGGAIALGMLKLLSSRRLN